MSQILVINPGSTTTKIALFENGEQEIFSETVTHSLSDLEKSDTIWDQFKLRMSAVRELLEQYKVNLASIGAVVGRGGLLRPISSGVYAINDSMLSDLQSAKQGEHASNLGAPIAFEIAKSISSQIPSFILDPVIVDELDEISRVSGHPLFPRKSIFHALGQKAVAKRYAKTVGRDYDSLNLIVAHMGGGITVGAHKKGQVVDVNNGLDGEGPMSPERSGTLPVGDIVKAAFSGEYSHGEMKQMLKGHGGMVAYLGTNSALEVEKRIKQGDATAELIFSAMAYQVAKSISSLVATFSNAPDAILLSGGLAKSEFFTALIKKRIEFLAPVFVNTEESEMSALAQGAYSALAGECEIFKY